MKFVGLPGWSCTRRIDCWMGQPMVMFDHFEQLEALKQPEKMRAWLPEEPWVLVTWSMGTLAGMRMSEVWGKRGPKRWIALSPFLEFAGDKSASRREDVDALKQSLLARPESALKLFTRGHGVRGVWMDQILTEERVQILANSLDLLCEPIVVSGQLKGLEIEAVYGENDSLVNTAMATDFADHVGATLYSPLKGVSHALFYEEPESLRALVTLWT